MKNTKFFNKVERKRVVIDAKDKVLGRLATRIAKILQGKHKSTYTPNFLCGDKVVVINANRIKITGNKMKDKIYTGYPGGLKEITLEKLINKNITKVLYLSVKNMLPRNLLRKSMLRSLKIYPDDKYPYVGENIQKIEV
ncbi:MAG: 50S ribosomal protein L13 [Candidatus Omnitrophica bacterium]|nr:50S ribosomal protein L13 [Candidatus Omnitrophota bacterium]